MTQFSPEEINLSLLDVRKIHINKSCVYCGRLHQYLNLHHICKCQYWNTFTNKSIHVLCVHGIFQAATYLNNIWTDSLPGFTLYILLYKSNDNSFCIVIFYFYVFYFFVMKCKTYSRNLVEPSLLWTALTALLWAFHNQYSMFNVEFNYCIFHSLL